MTGLGGDVLAVVVCRDGRLPAGADEATSEAGGRVLVAGRGARDAALSLSSAVEAWWAELPVGPASMAATLAGELEDVRCVVAPGSPDGRDLAPRLAASMGVPCLAGAVRVATGAGVVTADLLRVDGRVVVPVEVAGRAVATLLPGARSAIPSTVQAEARELRLQAVERPDAATVELIEPDPSTMDLADARRVLGGGAGLVPRGAGDAQSRAIFELLSAVAAALGASAGATRVVTDAGWVDHQRQIGTTGVSIDPDLYLAMGVSGASQHIAGLGNPRDIVCINTDPSCPMASLSNLSVAADALSTLVGLAHRLDVEVPGIIKELNA